MKKIALICVFAVLFTLCGCQSRRIAAGQSTSDASIYDLNDKIIGEIKPEYQNFIALDDGFVYSVTADNATDYYRYFFDGNKSEKLYSFEGETHQSPASAFIENQLYFLLLNKTESDGSFTLYLMKYDLKKNEMTPVSKDEKMYPDSSMCVDFTDAKYPALLILKNHVNNTELIKYDPKNDETTKVLQSAFENAKQSGDKIEAVYNSGAITTLLRLTQERSLWADSYDQNTDLLYSVNVSALSSSADERQQTVDSFCDYINFMYIENSSGLSFLGRNLNGEIKRSINNDILKAKDIMPNRDEAVFFDNKYLYQLKANAFSADIMRRVKLNLDSGFRVENIYVSPSNYLLICTVKTSASKNVVERKFYYIKLSDVIFDQRVKLQ